MYNRDKVEEAVCLFSRFRLFRKYNLNGNMIMEYYPDTIRVHSRVEVDFSHLPSPHPVN